MSRSIKFRVWDKRKNIYIHRGDVKIYGHGEVNVYDGDVYKDYVSVKSEDYSIEQFAGFEDSSGREVYEGDIVSWSEYQGWEDGRTIHGRYVVLWNEEELCFKFHDPFEGCWWPLTDADFDVVIGNIFENANLLPSEELEPEMVKLD